MLKLDIGGVFPLLEEPLPIMEALTALDTLTTGSGEGADYCGWLNIAERYPREAEFLRLNETGRKIRENAELLIVVGIGGSYLGARSAVELLRSSTAGRTAGGVRAGCVDIRYAGKGLSGSELDELIAHSESKDVYISMVSKSGTTLEPALAFRILKQYMEKRYGREGARRRIICTTDQKRGLLRAMADSEGYESFTIPNDIGGRYSVFTPAGLLPMSAAGIDIRAVLEGAAQSRYSFTESSEENPALVYAAVRHALFYSGRFVELLSFLGEKLRYLAEWWKQLYGESEGKQGSGIFPASAELTADMHSLGQYIQEGTKILQETMLRFDEPSPLFIPHTAEDADRLNYLAGKDFGFISDKAMEAIRQAHIDGGVPCMRIDADTLCEENYGALVMFFEYACGISGYMFGINPFDQPGVEAYKNNMFRLLRLP